MLGIGASELVLILIFGFIIFGPEKLPAMAKTIGRAIAKFRRAQAEMSDFVKSEVYDPSADDPFKNPLDALARLEKKVDDPSPSRSAQRSDGASFVEAPEKGASSSACDVPKAQERED